MTPLLVIGVFVACLGSYFLGYYSGLERGLNIEAPFDKDQNTSTTEVNDAEIK